MKKAVCISCTNHYAFRIAYIESFLRSKGFDVIYLTSNYDHFSKSYYTLPMEHCVQLPVCSYRKNLSAARLYSHASFSVKAYRYLKKVHPDLVFAMLPPNTLACTMEKYKKSHPECRMIFDFYDVWPEAFPLGSLKKIVSLPFAFWRNLRNHHLTHADLITTECDYYQERIPFLSTLPLVRTLHLTAEKKDNFLSRYTPSAEQADGIAIAYVGAINHLIDIARIIRLLSEIHRLRPVTVHIIGDGESREQWIFALQQAGIQTVFHGKIFEDSKKSEIFNQCAFGLNIMKPSVCVGLTMKSVEYFKHSLPILNSIPGDTARLVADMKIGYQLPSEESQYTTLAQTIASLSEKDLCDLRENTTRCFSAYFSTQAFYENLEAIYREMEQQHDTV